MAVALVGLIGVVAGAFVGGWMDSRLDERRRTEDAVEARNLIAAELEDAAIRLESAAAANQWIPALSVRSWGDGRKRLVAAVDHHTRDELTSSYGAIEAWNGESSDREGKALTDDERSAFGGASKAFMSLAAKLKKPSPEMKRRRRLRAVGAVAGATVVVALGISVLVPRPDLTDQTVASALQSKLGAGALAACREKTTTGSATPRCRRSTERRVERRQG